MSTTHDLAAVDLNLLVAFQALYDARSVTRAAAGQGLTQSAMSHTLRRLRDLTGDALFVRQGRRLAPTPRADAMIGPVRHALHSAARALASAPFDPATTTRRFTLASLDLFDLAYLPAILTRLHEAAPGVGLTIVPFGREAVDALHSGALDAAIHPVLSSDTPPLTTTGLLRRTLLHDGWCTIARRDHPRPPVDLDAYVAARHLVVSPSGGGPTLVDRALGERGHTREVAVRLPHFAPTLPLVAGSDLVLTAPATLAGLASAWGDALIVRPPPLPLPGHTVTLMWSERMTDDPGHAWFREAVAAATAGGR